MRFAQNGLADLVANILAAAIIYLTGVSVGAFPGIASLVVISIVVLLAVDRLQQRLLYCCT